jgi:SOS-response transcriptional repressor LexA
MNDRPPLTQRQKETLDFIRRFVAQHRYGPSTRDFMKALGLTSPNGATALIEPLLRKGYVTRARFTARSIMPVDDEPELERLRKVEYAAMMLWRAHNEWSQCHGFDYCEEEEEALEQRMAEAAFDLEQLILQERPDA